MNGGRKEEMNMLPPKVWPNQEIFCKTFLFRASLVVQMVKDLSAIGRPGFDLWAGKIPWRRVWQPTPVFLPGESQGQRSSVGYSPENHTELHTTEVTQHNNHFIAITFIAPKK